MLKWTRRLALASIVLLLIAALTAWALLRGSLPALDGDASLAGLGAAATIQRDANGVVTIDAASEADAMRALGYVHAQERYFEMDLLRRTAAGELSALFGPIALDTDKAHRIHRMRYRVQRDLALIAGDKRTALDAYVAGVNAGRDALDVRPWPYLLLRQRPAPWLAEDTPLVGYAMYFDLQDGRNGRELALWRLRPHLPPALYALLTRDGTRWDAPLAGEARGDAGLPDAGTLDLRRLPFPPLPASKRAETKGTPGSNNFAVSGALTADGRAIVADDMHLGLRAPNIWFRARLRYPGPAAPGGRVDVQGFTLPGLPAVIVGSNGHVAWGFTNSYGDYADWKLETPCGAVGASDDCARVLSVREGIAVAGSDTSMFDIDQTDWGPVLHREPDGRVLSLRWTAHLPGAVNLGITRFATARGLDEALSMADDTAIPTQNLVIGDANGRVAWRLLGPLAMRSDACEDTFVRIQPSVRVATSAQRGVESETQVSTARVPSHSANAGSIETGGSHAARTQQNAMVSAGNVAPDSEVASMDPRVRGNGGTKANATARSAAADACATWPIATNAAPLLRSPQTDRFWTANNRTLDGEPLKRMGDGGFAFGARAQQIRDGLFARETFNERDLLALQLDDRAVFLTPWWNLLRQQAARAKAPGLSALAQAAARWDGRASVDSVSYRIVRAWRLAVHARIADGLTAPAQAALGEDFVMPDMPQLEGVVWPLVTQRPPHLLPRRFASWNALLEDAAKEVRGELTQHGPLARRTWGERNTAAICHPLALAIPLIGKRLLCMPPDPLPGDGSMPRVQGPSFGASQRMVVSPGREADGVIHMPGGQSGHFLSPYWGAGHDDWVHGRPTPFLPGKTERTLRLAPPATTTSAAAH